MNRSCNIKINSEINQDKLKELISLIENAEGVSYVSFNKKTSILNYEISEWASDYDIMVFIINTAESMNIDAEPMFDGGEDMVLNNKTCDEEDDCDDEDECSECHREHHHEHCHDHSECHHEHHHDHSECHHEHCHDHSESVSFCECGHNGSNSKEDKKARIIKVVELFISLAFIIAGVIVSNIENLAKIEDYLYIIAFAVAGYEVVMDGIIKIFKKKPFSEQTLMTIASISALFLGEVIEATGIMLLYSVGTLFESTATADAQKVIDKLKDYKKGKVKILVDGVTEKTVSPSKVKIGDLVVVRSGEKVMVDGVIVSGSCSFDTKLITGESNYKDLSINDSVLSGFINVNGTVTIKAEKTFDDSALSRITKTVESSSKLKSKPEKFLEKFAKWFTPTVVIIAIIIAFIPPFFWNDYLIGLKIWGKRAVMLLCVSCPCSIVISVPLAYFIGASKLASKGVLIKGNYTLENLSKCNTVVFDKTGTLTEGKLALDCVIENENFKGELLNYASACEKYSNHPIALAIREKVNSDAFVVDDYQEVAGCGVKCVFNNKKVIAGNEKFLTENGVTVVKSLEVGAKLFVAVDNEFAGEIVFKDVLRSKALGTVLELRDIGVKNTVILTGDNKEYTSIIRKQLGVNRSVSSLLPEQKVKELEKIINSNQNGKVMFVGDGVNDAPVLARADVSVAMGKNGSDIACESADMVLTCDDLSKIPFSIKIAKRTNFIAKQNVVISLIIKAVVMILGTFGLTTNLWLAIGADVGVLIIALLNALRNKLNLF